MHFVLLYLRSIRFHIKVLFVSHGAGVTRNYVRIPVAQYDGAVTLRQYFRVQYLLLT